MKKILMMLAITAFAGVSAQAQTNRTYRTDMNDQRIRTEERRGSNLTPAPTRLNTGSNNQETLPFRPTVDTAVGNTYSGNTTNGATMTPVFNNAATISNDRWRHQQYDTSKNNGRIIGGGSGTTTDPHPTMQNR